MRPGAHLVLRRRPDVREEDVVAAACPDVVEQRRHDLLLGGDVEQPARLRGTRLEEPLLAVAAHLAGGHRKDQWECEVAAGKK